jgi:hypothetical protein
MSPGLVQAMSVLSWSMFNVPPIWRVAKQSENCWRTSPLEKATMWARSCPPPGSAQSSLSRRFISRMRPRSSVTTKSRRYSVTMGALRAIRATSMRQQVAKDCSSQHHSLLDSTEQSDGVWWKFDRAGHATPGDRTLVYSAARQQIHTRRTGLVEVRRQAREEHWDSPADRDN